jgi:hypothetical protein
LLKVKITINPVLDILTGKLLSHDGQYDIPDELVTLRFDRSAQAQAKGNKTTADTTGSTLGTEASGIGGAVIPGLEREATNPQGFAPTDVNNMLVAGGEAVGGANAGITGEANLEAARTRNAGGFASALDEAARVKSRALSTNALDVSGRQAAEKEKQRQFAQGQLTNIMQSDRANQLRAMGLSEEAIQQELAAGRQGWFQQALDVANTVTGAGKAAGGIISALNKGGGGGSSG